MSRGLQVPISPRFGQYYGLSRIYTSMPSRRQHFTGDHLGIATGYSIWRGSCFDGGASSCSARETQVKEPWRRHSMRCDVVSMYDKHTSVSFLRLRGTAQDARSHAWLVEWKPRWLMRSASEARCEKRRLHEIKVIKKTQNPHIVVGDATRQTIL